MKRLILFIILALAALFVAANVQEPKRTKPKAEPGKRIAAILNKKSKGKER